jgi:hypothetical protein
VPRPQPACASLCAAVLALAAATALCSPLALAAGTHRFTATYTGHGAGTTDGTSASGSGSAIGRGRLIGPSTLHGSGKGTVTSDSCVVFGATMVLRGRPGSLRLAVRRAPACVTDASSVSFSGKAKVTRGTSTFAGARGTLSFKGRYDTQSGAVTISFRGSISY